MRNQMGTEGSRGREGHHTDAGDSGASIVVSPRLSCVWGVGGPQPPPLKSDGGCEARLWCMLNDCGKDSGNVGGSKCGNAKRDPDGDCESGMIQSCLKRGESGSVSRDSMEFMSRLPMEFLRKGLQAIGLAPPERDERSLGEKVRAGQYVPIAPHYSAELHNMIKKCLQVDPTRRPSINDILEHPIVVQYLQAMTPEERGECSAPTKRESSVLMATIRVPRQLNQLAGRLPGTSRALDANSVV